jgi:predicted phage terminase large subunit-like protein
MEATEVGMFHKMWQTLGMGKLRKELCRHSFIAFCLWYFSHYMRHALDKFHYGMMKNLQNDAVQLMVEIMFRGSAKSSIGLTMYAVWCIAYRKRRFIIIASDLASSAQTQMDTVIYELQNNRRLIADFGHLFVEEKPREGEIAGKKRKTVRDFITRNNVRVLLRAKGMKVRGERYNQIRPELALIDDPESIQSAESETERRKMMTWVKNELMGGMSQTHSKIVVFGNWLGTACLVAKLSEDPAWHSHKVPIILDEGLPTQRLAWRDRYTMTREEARTINRAKRDANGGVIEPDDMVISIEGLRHKFGSYVFRREFMLEAISEDEQIIKNYWVKWVEPDQIPPIDQLQIRVYLDPAVGQNEKKNDPSAWLVSGYDPKTKRLYFIDAYEEWLSFENIKKQTKTLCEYYGTWRPRIEAQTAFDYLCQQLETENRQMAVKRIRQTKGKKNRLMGVSVSWERGDVYVMKGNEKLAKLVTQTTLFGTEEHDDLCDVGMFSVEENLLAGKKGGIRKR